MNIINQALKQSSINSGFYELNPDYIKQHNYGVKVQLDGFGPKQIHYIYNILGCTEGYMLYWLYEKGDDFKLKFNTVDELYLHCIEKHASGAEIIIEFVGSDVYFYESESDFYLIFGKKDNLKLIDDYQFSDEKTLKILDHLNKGRSDYYQWLYDTYQHL